MSNGNNKTNKTHRDLLKNAKRNSDGLNYNTQPSTSDSASRGNTFNPATVNVTPKKKPTRQKTREEITGVIYDPVKKRVDAAKQANPLVRLFTGIKPMGS
tara:strand:+ start:77 stop:376 length:300 start_codon:yes stop_codon:yes gene_type:complete